MSCRHLALLLSVIACLFSIQASTSPAFYLAGAYGSTADLLRISTSTQGATSTAFIIDANGKNSIAFPWSTRRMQELLTRFDLENYHATAPARSRARAEGVSADV